MKEEEVNADQEMADEGEAIDGFSATTQESRQNHQEMLMKMEQKWKARQIAVPTNDKLVQLRLRELKEPIILFGEPPEDRRTRLRELLAKIGSDQGLPSSEIAKMKKREEEEAEEGDENETRMIDTKNEQLRKTRQWILHYSLQKARERILKQQREREDETIALDREKESEMMCLKATKWQCSLSQIGDDDRPLSSCSISSADGSLILTGSWSGIAKIWQTSDCECVQLLNGQQKDRILGCSFHPSIKRANYSQAQDSQPQTTCSVATATSSGDILLFCCSNPNPIKTLQGHSGIANRVAFHPSGSLLGSTGNDCIWRLWDVEKGACLQEQKGHTHGIHGICFQCDGGLVATCGADAHVRVWDIRSGNCVHLFEGHVDSVICSDWSPNGFLLASGSIDNSVRLWDLRHKKCVSMIPAHNGLVSSVKFDKKNGDVLTTSSFDGNVKSWSINIDCTRWTPISTLKAHESKVVGLDLTDEFMVTCSFDRTWKLWKSSLV